MKTNAVHIVLLTATLLFRGVAASQSLEYYAGHKRTGVDLMWFKYFRNKDKQNTPVLFFSRNRASVDYKNAPTAFGSTNAVSYNFKNGIGLVGVASFVNAGFTPKAGIQYYRQKGAFMFFGWLVADIKEKGNVDLFGMFRLTPAINHTWKSFGQVELFPIYTPNKGNWNLTQRIRLGAKVHAWAGGLMMDFNQVGKKDFTTTSNIGAFVRYDF